MNFGSLLNTASSWSNQIGGILGNIGSISGGISSLFGSKKNERRAIRRQKEMLDYNLGLQKNLMDYENQINLGNWNMENEYNSPSAQYQRLKDAGLNPNLMYGGSSGFTPAGDVGSPSASLSGDTGNAMGLDLMRRQQDIANFNNLRQGALMDSQVNLNDAQANKLNAEAAEVAPNAGSQRAVNSAMERHMSVQAGQVEYYTDWLNSTHRLRYRELLNKLDLQQRDRDNALAQFATSMYNLNQIMPLKTQELRYTLEHILPQQVEKVKSEMHLNDKQATYYTMNALYLGSLKFATDTETGWKRSLYGSNAYRTSIINKAIGDGRYSVERSYNEQKGWPYASSGWLGSGLSINNLLLGIYGSKPKTPATSTGYGSPYSPRPW